MARYTLIAPNPAPARGSEATSGRSIICDVNSAPPIPRTTSATAEAREFEVRLDGVAVRALLLASGPPLLFSIAGKPHEVVQQSPGEYRVLSSGASLRVATSQSKRTSATVSASTLLAPMPGRVVRVACKPGDVVEAGTSLVVLEAMKMENELIAPARGRVEQVLVQEGSTVEARAKLVVLGEP